MKERERKKLSLEDMAGRLELPVEEYRTIEAGDSEAEKWGPLLAKVAIKLETPTSRLLADSGKFAETNKEQGQAGQLIRKHRERRQKSAEDMAKLLEISDAEYREIEDGGSGIEKWGPFFLHFAEIIEQPVFNLFYPFGLPLDKLRLEDYKI
jgi:transcriptional regulator with XRE-family HTH domain